MLSNNFKNSFGPIPLYDGKYEGLTMILASNNSAGKNCLNNNYFSSLNGNILLNVISWLALI